MIPNLSRNTKTEKQSFVVASLAVDHQRVRKRARFLIGGVCLHKIHDVIKVIAYSRVCCMTRFGGGGGGEMSNSRIVIAFLR